MLYLQDLRLAGANYWREKIKNYRVERSLDISRLQQEILEAGKNGQIAISLGLPKEWTKNEVMFFVLDLLASGFNVHVKDGPIMQALEGKDRFRKFLDSGIRDDEVTEIIKDFRGGNFSKEITVLL